MKHRPERVVPNLSGWGRYPISEARLVRPERKRDFAPCEEATTVRGLGRSYGDAALNSQGVVMLTERLDRLLSFDSETGVLRAEAGVSLDAVLKAMVPHGWFLPVTPGTKFCTLGGCLASDVHGKNHHHAGTFSGHVESCRIVLADGRECLCGPDLRPELFWATAGGMGLTGAVSEVSLRLQRIETAWMEVRHTAVRDLDHAIDLLSDPEHDSEYTVCWVDCLASGNRLGRGVFMAGRHLPKAELSLAVRDPLAPHKDPKRSIPFDLPEFVLGPFSVKVFNALYSWAQARKRRFVCHYDPFFYPLDKVADWNRAYGKKGFVQYQYVVPTESAKTATKAVLERLAAEKCASFLSVLKRFGEQGQGLLSFPKPGLTLALDIPMRPNVLPILDDLDELVHGAGGRVYLAKDARLGRAELEKGYPRLQEFRSIRQEADPSGLFKSDLSRRLGI